LTTLIEITPTPILPETIINKVRKDAYGCVVTFIGTVRGFSSGKRVLLLEFNAKAKGQVEKEIQQIAEEIQARWQLEDIAICHRMGRLKVGEITLVIAIAAPHRQEAFAACQYAVDRLKQIAPLWKREATES